MPAATIDEYLASVPEDKRAALQLLRDQIRASAPDATEAISYGLPSFTLEGRWLVGFSATKKHCSFYAGAGPLKAHTRSASEYVLGKLIWFGVSAW